MAMYRISGLAVVVIAAIVLSASASAEVATPELFGVSDNNANATQQMQMSFATFSMVAAIATSTRTVTLNGSVLHAKAASITLGETRHVAVLATMENRSDHQSVGSMWSWKLEGASAPSVITERNGFVTGMFFSSDRRRFFLMPGHIGQPQMLIEVAPNAAELLRQRQMENDAIVFPGLDEMSMPSLEPATAPIGVHEVKDLEVYNQDAADTMGGDAQIEAVIQNQVDLFNVALLNNGYTEGRLRLVHVQKYVRDETGDSGVDLHTLSIDPFIIGDPNNPGVPGLRDLYRADLVGEFVGNQSGFAYMPGIAFDKRSGFHITGTIAAILDLQFLHEVAHNLNGQHDQAFAPPVEGDPYGYNRGYVDPNGMYSDALSYTLVVEPFFSSSSGTWQGGPMGTPSQDNMRAMRIAFPMVAGYYSDPDCVPSATALCLITTTGATQGAPRFQVEVTWIDFAGESGQGQAVGLTTDSGYFWFFGPANMEVVVKMANGVSFNGHFWVFVAGLTNVGVDITITDTATGVVWSGHNPLGTAFQPIQDTEAFPQ